MSAPPSARRRPRVAVDLRPLVPRERAGIGWFTFYLVRALCELGGVQLVALGHERMQGLDELAAAGLEILPASSLAHVYTQRLRVSRPLRKARLDLFWSPVNTLPLVHDLPGVVSLHDLSGLILPHTQSLKVRLGTRVQLARTVRDAARIATASEASRTDILARFPEAGSRLRVVPHGVEPALSPAPQSEISATRTRLGCPGGYLLYAGTLEPRKNLIALFEAWIALRRRRCETPPLLLTGARGWRNRELRARLAELEHAGLRHLGYLPRAELISVLRAASAFVYPSLYEGFGLPPLEAMACGVPTLVARASSMPEVAGGCAALFDPGRAESLVGELERLLFDRELATELARRGPARAAEYTWERAAEGLQAVFDEIA